MPLFFSCHHKARLSYLQVIDRREEILHLFPFILAQHLDLLFPEPCSLFRLIVPFSRVGDVIVNLRLSSTAEAQVLFCQFQGWRFFHGCCLRLC